MGDLKGALDSLQRAVNMRSNLLGDHKETASSYYWLGLVQRDIGDLKGALDSLERATNMESNLLDDHEDTAYSTIGLVQCSVTWETLKELWNPYKKQQTCD